MSAGAANSGKLSKSRVRKRSVRFGNPSLFTYHGCLYTIEGVGDDLSSVGRGGDGSALGMNRAKTIPSSLQSRPLIEGAEQAERLAAMVRVPPEQVPEGVLNLVRSHRPWIHHVRIVIEDPEDESNDDQSSNNNAQPMQSSHASAKSGGSSSFDGNEQVGGGSLMTSPTALAVESAASILAAEHHRVIEDSGGLEEQRQQHVRSQSSSRLEWEKEQPLSSPAIHEQVIGNPSRTYLVLFEMCDEAAAEQLVGLLHGQPYTCLDESQVCSLYHVAAIHGDDGVSLMSPFFASSATQTATQPSNPVSSHHGSSHGLEIVPNSSSASAASSSDSKDDNNTRGARASGGRQAPAPAPSSNGNGASASTTTGESLAASNRLRLPSVATADDYNCAVCLERLDWDHLGVPAATNTAGAGGEKTSILTTVCKYVHWC